MKESVCVLLFCLGISGCGGDDPPVPSTSGRGTEQANRNEREILFVDRTEPSGLGAFQQTNGDAEKGWITGSIGGGVAFVDHDRDGDLDVYLTNGSRMGDVALEEAPRDALFAQDGQASGRFVDKTQAAGLGDPHWTSGVRTCDVDGDGWSDLFLTNNGPNAFYRNEQGVFREEADRLGLADAGWGTGSAFLDYDRDGDLDLYVANYIALDMDELFRRKPTQSYRGVEVFFGPRGLPEAKDLFYRQEADGSFAEVSAETGVASVAAFGLGVVAFDYDEDGWVDVYVANDSTPNLLWRNEKGKAFADAAMFAGVALSLDGTPQAGMGVAVGDFDADMHVDLYVTNFAEDYYTLYRGEGGGLFRDQTSRMNLRVSTMPYLGWATEFHDLDNDGDLDLFAVNGHVFPQVDRFDLGTSYKQRNSLFVNRAGRLVPAAGGPAFELEQASRGAAVGDFDRDGRLDLLVGNIDGSPALLRNETESPGNWLGVRLEGGGKNRDAIGARVVAHVGEHRALRLVGTSAGFLSSSDLELSFGLGAAQAVERIEVTWPDGEKTSYSDVLANRRIVLNQANGLSER